MELNNIIVISIMGRIDHLSCGKLDKYLKNQVHQGNVNLVLDFKNVDFTDADGLRVLLSSIKETRAKGGDILLVNTSPLIQDILITTGFSNQFQIFTDMNTALMNFQYK